MLSRAWDGKKREQKSKMHTPSVTKDSKIILICVEDKTTMYEGELRVKPTTWIMDSKAMSRMPTSSKKSEYLASRMVFDYAKELLQVTIRGTMITIQVRTSTFIRLSIPFQMATRTSHPSWTMEFTRRGWCCSEPKTRKLKEWLPYVGTKGEKKAQSSALPSWSTINKQHLRELPHGRGIAHYSCIAFHPHQNGTVERFNGTLKEHTKTMFIAELLPLWWWECAIKYVT